MPTIDINPQFQATLGLMENSHQHVFLTGRAGTGKSTLLNHFRLNTKKKVAVVAPTGVAAINVHGQTIHSFFRFRPDVTPDTVSRIRPTSEQLKLYRSLDTLIIDEVSMLRADLLDCIDRFLRTHGPHKGSNFGGIQMVFIGDLYQLPPVLTSSERAAFTALYKSPFFFDAKVIDEIGLYKIELDHIYRQKDDDFITILNAIRENIITEEQLELLNSRLVLNPQQPEGVIALTTTNDLAHRINEHQLDLLPGTSFSYSGKSSGTFNERDFPTPSELNLKHGAQVMILTNDTKGRWVNGSIGKVIAIYDEPGETDPTIEIELTGGKTVKILPYTWETSRFVFNDSTEQLETETMGTYRQYPLRLAWAVTIHKSQGSTFDNVIIDLGRGTFSHGQLYVALSRCRTLAGVILKQPIVPRHIISDNRILEFISSFKEGFRQVGQASLNFDETWSEWGA